MFKSPVCRFQILFLLTPLREGRPDQQKGLYQADHFYSRPCGRGDVDPYNGTVRVDSISTHAPAGGATRNAAGMPAADRHLAEDAIGGEARWRGPRERAAMTFLLTPLREGRLVGVLSLREFCRISTHAPAGGATIVVWLNQFRTGISTHAPAGGATFVRHFLSSSSSSISTHAPAGGATAIFHKSVMRFCGKLPKDDTVLCLASFGFPRRDPKAVYLAWISCANLPQKCVRQGLALKDQGTSCFHEGLASHAFDPVLV